LSDILRTVTVGIGDQPAVVADVQSALDALAVVGSAAGRTRLRRIPFGNGFDADTFGFSLVVEHRREAVERPPMQIEVAVVAPVGGFTVVVLADSREIANNDCPNVALGTLCDNRF
jgi:hypothetical protein